MIDIICRPFLNKINFEMNEEISAQFGKSTQGMDAAIEHLQGELQKIRAGKASPSMLNGILVDYYGSMTPLTQVANILTSDSRTLSIQPWEKSMIGPIEQAIFAANIGITPQNNGEMIIINIPPLTEERRKEMVKRAKSLGEDCKVTVRGLRQKSMDVIKKEVKDGYPEDMGKDREADMQKIVNSYSDKIKKMIESKENDIMTI